MTRKADMVHTKTPDTAPSTRRRRWFIPVSVLAAVLLAISGGLLWFFGGEAPAEVDLAATASSVADDDGVATDEEPTDIGGIDGTWTVDSTTGVFTVDGTTTATFVGFRVEEVLSSIGSATAVGRTPGVSGSISIEGTTLASAEVTADMTSIVSDQARREDAIQRSLGTSANPEATFVLTQPIELGAEAAEGEAISVVAAGEMTINGVTNDVEVDLEAQLVDGQILVTGTTEIAFDDFGVTAPTSPAVLSVEDNGVVEFQLWLSR